MFKILFICLFSFGEFVIAQSSTDQTALPPNNNLIPSAEASKNDPKLFFETELNWGGIEIKGRDIYQKMPDGKLYIFPNPSLNLNEYTPAEHGSVLYEYFLLFEDEYLKNRNILPELNPFLFYRIEVKKRISEQYGKTESKSELIFQIEKFRLNLIKIILQNRSLTNQAEEISKLKLENKNLTAEINNLKLISSKEKTTQKNKWFVQFDVFRNIALLLSLLVLLALNITTLVLFLKKK